MSSVEQGKFSCNSCGKSYKWKPEFAGRKVKCKCGFVMTAPQAAPAAAPPVDDGPDLDALYSLADEGKQAAAAAPATIRCPSCRSELQLGASLCAECGFNLKTGTKASRKAAGGAVPAGAVPAGAGGGAAVAPTGAAAVFQAYGAPRTRGEDLKVERNDAILDWYVPIGLLVAGTVLGVLHFTTFNGTTVPVPQALMYTGLKLIISFILIAVASVFLIKWMEIAFGDPAQAALKIAAAVTAPVAVANIISYLIKDAPPYGWGLVGFFLAFGMFFILYHYLFEWDMSEKWIVVGVTTVVCMLVTPFAFTALIHGGPSALAAQTENDDDQTIELMIEFGRTKPAREWLFESNNRLISDFPRGHSEELINGLEALRPPEILIVPDGPHAAELYVKLPKDAKKRQEIYDFYAEWAKTVDRGPIEDHGGKWMMVIYRAVPHPTPVSVF